MKTMQKNSRRNFIRNSALAAAGSLSILSIDWEKASAKGYYDPSFTPDEGTFKLPPLPYTFDALEPYIDAKTMEIHYTKHHQAYVDKLNAAIVKISVVKGKNLVELIS
jgi:hypothetical protein